jgi:circadian clock protein KaiC
MEMKNREILMGNQIDPNTQESSEKNATGIRKIRTQIEGLDEILHGGVPQGRVTLVCGAPGTGKTLLGLEFLYRSAQSGHPGIFLSFEETAENIRQNTLSLGWDLPFLEKAGKLFLMEGQLNPEVIISGEFNLTGFLSIIEGKAQEMGANRVVIDALDVIMLVFNNPRREQQQIIGVHNWLMQHGLTAILTAKNLKTPNTSSPYEYLDYIADCVIYLDQRIENQVNTKRIQVVKYRGTSYGSNEYPFLITGKGLFFNAISDMRPNYEPPSQRVSSGSQSLDEILGGGYLKGTCVLISGASGTGKTSIAATFARSACEGGHKVLYVNFEESVSGMVAGMHSLGIDLGPAMHDCSLWVKPAMPESKGIEEHLYDKITAIKSFQSDHVVVDAISACKRIAGKKASFDFIMRLVHFCKKRGLTTILINQSNTAEEAYGITGIGISSVVDTIIFLSYKDVGNETRRILQVIKSRGSKHSNRRHSYALTDEGIRFEPKPPG